MKVERKNEAQERATVKPEEYVEELPANEVEGGKNNHQTAAEADQSRQRDVVGRLSQYIVNVEPGMSKGQCNCESTNEPMVY